MRARLLGVAVAVAALSMGGATASSQQGEPGDEPEPGAGLEPAGPAGPPAGASLAERDRWLSQAIAAAVAARPSLAGARIGIAAIDVASGHVAYQRDADAPFNVASNAKIVTTAAALSLLGADFEFATAVYADPMGANGVVAGDLYLRGRADPTLGTAELRELVHQLALAGVTKIKGRIVIDDSYFDGQDSPPHFDSKPEDQAAYRAPIGAVSLNYNMVTVVVRPGAAGQVARVQVDPPSDYVRVKGEVVTVAQGRSRVAVASKEVRDALEVTVTGQLRVDAGLQRHRLRVPAPAQFMGRTLRALLEERRIAVGRKSVERRLVPPTARPIAGRRSAPLAVVVRALGKYSNNYVAEMVLKTIGAETRSERVDPATWADGLAAVRAYLVDEVGLTAGSFRYDNGSGLFDASSFSPRQIAQVLRHAYLDFRAGPDLVASLATAGADGTLRSRMIGSAAERQVRAKTGTLNTVVTLSGYAAVRGTAPLAFSIAVNDLDVARRGSTAKRDARTLVDDIAALLVQYAQAG